MVENSATISTTLSSISSVNQTSTTTPTEKKTSPTVTAPVVDNVKSSTKTTATVKPTVSVKKETYSKQPEFLQEKQKTQLKQKETQKTETTQPLAEPVVAAPTIQQGAAVLKENVSNFMEFKAENEDAERTKNGFILLSLLQQKEVGEARNLVSRCNGIIDFNVFDRETEDFPLQAAIRNKQEYFVDILSQQPIRTSNFGRVARFIASEYVDAYRRNDNDTARYYADNWNKIKGNYIRQQQTIFRNNSSYIGKTIEFCRIVDSCFNKKEIDYGEITQAGIDLTRAKTKAMQTMVDSDVKRILHQDNPESHSIQMNSLNGNYSTVSTRPVMQPMPPMQPTPVMPAMQPIQPMQVMPARYPMQAMQQMPAMQSMRAVQSMPAMQPMPPMQVMPARYPMQAMQQMPVIQPMPVAQPMPAMQSMRVVQSMPAMQPRQVIQSTPATIVRVNRNQGNQRGNENSMGGL